MEHTWPTFEQLKKQIILSKDGIEPLAEWLDNILLEQNNTENLITSMSVGNDFREATRPSYRILQEKINFVLGSYNRTNAISVLRRLASLTSF
ncbi:hypothetical protein HZS_14 [Henneguya salminicola]|nr:hypothetical protein HZS_14 [Henneguya salminicola]